MQVIINMHIQYTQLCALYYTISILQAILYIYIYFFFLLNKNSFEMLYRIGKLRMSFSGSQYGSCSTTYNTLPVKKVVYN